MYYIVLLIVLQFNINLIFFPILLTLNYYKYYIKQLRIYYNIENLKYKIL